jgi:hypothetical protein
MRSLLVAGLISVCLVAPAVAEDSGYHEVWEPDALSWKISIQKYAELYGRGSDDQQYRWQSVAQATICEPPYYVPEPEFPGALRKVIIDEAVLYPWIEVHIRENDIHWDLFKPRVFMGKTFQMWIAANTPIQILFGCGTISVPDDFDLAENEIIWADYTEDSCLTDKIRIKSILGKGVNDQGTPPDEIKEYLWWYPYIPQFPNDEPDPHRITTVELGLLPAWGDFSPTGWQYAPDLNGMIWTYDDTDELHEGGWFQFFEVLDVDSCDSEGKYYKELVVTVAPDP